MVPFFTAECSVGCGLVVLIDFLLSPLLGRLSRKVLSSATLLLTLAGSHRLSWPPAPGFSPTLPVCGPFSVLLELIYCCFVEDFPFVFIRDTGL